jgi:hypothetical protein
MDWDDDEIPLSDADNSLNQQQPKSAFKFREYLFEYSEADLVIEREAAEDAISISLSDSEDEDRHEKASIRNADLALSTQLSLSLAKSDDVAPNNKTPSERLSLSLFDSIDEGLLPILSDDERETITPTTKNYTSCSDASHEDEAPIRMTSVKDEVIDLTGYYLLSKQSLATLISRSS